MIRCGRFLLFLLGLLLTMILAGGCAGEPRPPYLKSSAASEGLIGDQILFCEYLSGYYFVGGEGAITNHYLLNIANVDGSGLTKLLDEQTLKGIFLCFDLAPDGNRLAFFSADGYLCLLGIDSREVTRLVTAEGVNIAWSPDGSKIAYTSGGDLYVINADGGDNRKLAEHKSASYHGSLGEVTGGVNCPLWSADGKHIIFDNFTAPQFLFGGIASDIRNRCIYSVDIATAEIRTVKCGAKIVGPGPDKAKFTINAGTDVSGKYTTEWLVMDDAGTLYPEYQGALGKWSPDGNATAMGMPLGKLFVLNPITLEHIEKDEIENVADFIWSDGGQHIAYVSGNEIHIVSRDLSRGFRLYQMPELERGAEEPTMKLMLVDWLGR